MADGTDSVGPSIAGGSAGSAMSGVGTTIATAAGGAIAGRLARQHEIGNRQDQWRPRRHRDGGDGGCLQWHRQRRRRNK